MEGIRVEAWVLFAAVIALLFLVGFISALSNIVRYATHEANALKTVARRLRSALEPVAPAQEAPAGELSLAEEPAPDVVAAEKPRELRRLIGIPELREGINPHTMIADRLASIEKLRAAHTKINVAALQQMTLAREAATRWLAWPGYIANACMMVGLFGTVFGLSLVLGELGRNLPSSNAEITIESMMAMADQIRGVLGSMNTAFSATIAGLVASIVLSWFNQQLSRSQAKLLNRLDRFTVEELLPATVPVTDDESLLERVSLQLEASFARLDDTLQTNRTLLDHLGTVEKSLVEIVNGVRDSRTAAEAGRGPELIGPLTGVLEQVARLNETVARVTGSLPDVLGEAQRANRATLERLDKAIGQANRPLFESGLSPAIKLALGGMATLNVLVVLVLVLR